MSEESNNEEKLSNALSDFPYSFKTTSKALDIKGDFEKYAGKEVSIAGRIMAIRKAGKLVFIDILDQSGKIQGYFDYNIIQERFENLKTFNMGDIIGITGNVFKTNPGEISINANQFTLLAKALKVLPNKWKGVQDTELRYRRRYLDLIMNNDTRTTLANRSNIIKLIRGYLDNIGFIEFETPTIQPLYGGADAEPFRTFVNTLNEEDYLRISNELYLKRLLIGGFEKIYEVYKAFRNEDIDTTHSPEFTMLEAYQAYVDYEEMMRIAENMLESVTLSMFNSTTIKFQEKEISMKAPFKRIKYVDSINEVLGLDILSLSEDELFSVAEKNGIRFDKGKRFRAHAYDKLFETLVQPKLNQPTFATDFPKETSPLTRPKRGDSRLVERFELYISGMEIANAYSELNNPIIQKRNFEEEEKKAKIGDKEAEPLDMDFIEAMEYGMPPAGGIGIGIDRLVMILTGHASIKEVIAFPMEKRERKEKTQEKKDAIQKI
jgi:lysyl-tRNA synthetase class 2